MSPEIVRQRIQHRVTRRHFLSSSGAGIGTAALASLLNLKQLEASPASHFAPKAKRMIWLTQAGRRRNWTCSTTSRGLPSSSTRTCPIPFATASG